MQDNRWHPYILSTTVLSDIFKFAQIKQSEKTKHIFKGSQITIHTSYRDDKFVNLWALYTFLSNFIQLLKFCIIKQRHKSAEYFWKLETDFRCCKQMEGSRCGTAFIIILTAKYSSPILRYPLTCRLACVRRQLATHGPAHLPFKTTKIFRRGFAL